jgi:hypothetical protein
MTTQNVKLLIFTLYFCLLHFAFYIPLWRGRGAQPSPSRLDTKGGVYA